MQTFTLKIVFILLLLTLRLTTADPQHSAPETSSPIKVSKVSFLIHPVCWDLALAKGNRIGPNFRYQSFTYRGGAWYDEKEFYEILEWERQVNQRQKEYIRGMKSDEALIIYPIGQRPAMKELEELGQRILDRRCIIIRSESPSANEKVDYRAMFPNPVKIQLLDDLLEAVRYNSDTWNAQALEVIFYNRMIALEIKQEFKKRQLKVDPKTVTAVAFGEGFEQCATTWKAMVGEYLGWAKPIENDYNLSVSGMPLLRGAILREKISLKNVRLFLWKLQDQRTMAWLARTGGRLSDPQLFISLPFGLKEFKLFDEFGTQLWPKPVREKEKLGGVHWWWMGLANDSPIRLGFKGHMRVPIAVGLIQLPTDRNIFIVSNGVSFETFRKSLIESPIVPDMDSE